LTLAGKKLITALKDICNCVEFGVLARVPQLFTYLSIILYASCTFVFKDGLIQSFTAKIPAESMRYIMEKWQNFMPRITKHYPDEYLRMFASEGRFIYNRENGKDVVPLLREWRISQAK
jgi:hypothetical protein